MPKEPVFQTPNSSELENDNVQELINEGVLDEKLEQNDVNINQNAEADLTDSDDTDLSDRQIIRTNQSAS
jgi:hypothetical protein